jgi:hypothetical protein
MYMDRDSVGRDGEDVSSTLGTCNHSRGMLFISSIHYCVGACVQGIKPPTFACPKEPHAQESGIAVCSPLPIM